MRTGIHPETVLGSVTCLTCGTIFALRSTAGDHCRHVLAVPPRLHRPYGQGDERKPRRALRAPARIARTHRRSRAREYHRSFNS